MLSLLHIENIAVIERAEIRFDGGFNALTGETGAGKSIVIDAISAVTGERTSRELIRTGAKSALVEAVFSGVVSTPWLEEHGFSPGEDGELLLRREIQTDGKNVCRVNGRLLTVSQLKELGGRLVNIHGQHDGQQLLDERCHLDYLDRFGGAGALRAEYSAAFETLMGLSREIEALEIDEAEKARRVDALQYQIAELERARLKPGEDLELAARREVLRNAGKLVDAVERAHAALSGDEERDGAAALISMAERDLRRVSQVGGAFSELAEQLTELRLLADDAVERIRDLRAGLDVSPGALDEVESRLDTIYRLRRKYGDTVEEMLDYLARSKQELERISSADEVLAALRKRQSDAREDALRKAKLLSAHRQKEAGRLRGRIQSELSQLDMPKVQFQVDFAPKGGAWGMDSSGMDEARFLMSANVGEALKPIQKIASGGELSRIMLALKNVLAEDDEVDTLIFDEVDTGVSGRAAQRVAEKLASVSRVKQVLCVTHLPQLAAMADTHFSVEKRERGGRTFTAVERLERGARREALARLTGGDAISDSMLEGAGELLAAAADYKEKIRGKETGK